jgi:hypothetical protein
MDESAIKRAEDRKVGRLPSESLPRDFRPEQPAAPKIRPDAMRTTPMLMSKEERPVIQTLRGWVGDFRTAGRLTSPKHDWAEGRTTTRERMVWLPSRLNCRRPTLETRSTPNRQPVEFGPGRLNPWEYRAKLKTVQNRQVSDKGWKLADLKSGQAI